MPCPASDRACGGLLVKSATPLWADPPAGCEPWLESGGAWWEALQERQQRELRDPITGNARLCFVSISASEIFSWIGYHSHPARRLFALQQDEFLEDSISANRISQDVRLSYPSAKSIFEASANSGGNGGVRLLMDDQRWGQYTPEHPGWVSEGWSADTLPIPVQLPFELFSDLQDASAAAVYDSTMVRLHAMGVDTSQRDLNYFVLVWAHPQSLLSGSVRLPVAFAGRGMMIPLDYNCSFLPTGYLTRMVLGALGLPEQPEACSNLPRANILCRGFLGGEQQNGWRPAWLDPRTEAQLGWLPVSVLERGDDVLSWDNQRRVYAMQMPNMHCMYVEVFNWRQPHTCGVPDGTCLRASELYYSHSTASLHQIVELTPAIENGGPQWGSWPGPEADSLVVGFQFTGFDYDELRSWEMEPACASSADSVGAHIRIEMDPVPVELHLVSLEKNGMLYVDLDSLAWAQYQGSTLEIQVDENSFSMPLSPLFPQHGVALDLGTSFELYSRHEVEVRAQVLGQEYTLFLNDALEVTPSRRRLLPRQVKGAFATMDNRLFGQDDSTSFYYINQHCVYTRQHGYQNHTIQLAAILPDHPDCFFEWYRVPLSGDTYLGLYNLNFPSTPYYTYTWLDVFPPAMAMGEECLFTLGGELMRAGWESAEFHVDSLHAVGSLFCVSMVNGVPRICTSFHGVARIINLAGQVIFEETLTGYSDLGQPFAMDSNGDGLHEFYILSSSGVFKLEAEQVDQFVASFIPTESAPRIIVPLHQQERALPLLLCDDALYFDTTCYGTEDLPDKLLAIQSLASAEDLDDDILLGVFERGLYRLSFGEDMQIHLGQCLARVHCSGEPPVLTRWNGQELVLLQRADGIWLEYSLENGTSWSWTGRRGGPGQQRCDAQRGVAPPDSISLVHTTISYSNRQVTLHFEVDSAHHTINGFKIFRSTDPYHFPPEPIATVGPCVDSWTDPESPLGAYYRTQVRYDEPYGYICPDRAGMKP